MGALLKVVDAILVLFFVVIALSAPLIDSQTCLPVNLHPNLLVDVNNWFTREFGDYLVDQRPHFFVGLVWHELLFQWPLALINLYGILRSKSWVNTTCLIFGASCITAMAAILAEMVGSGKASDKMFRMYLPFLGLGILAMLRGLGLLTQSGEASSNATAMAWKKKA